MRHTKVNVYIGAFVITVVGAIASYILIGAAWKTESYYYTDTYFAPERGDARAP